LRAQYRDGGRSSGAATAVCGQKTGLRSWGVRMPVLSWSRMPRQGTRKAAMACCVSAVADILERLRRRKADTSPIQANILQGRQVLAVSEDRNSVIPPLPEVPTVEIGA
jgi:hypothetical protein